jgi:hypothetical protein
MKTIKNPNGRLLASALLVVALGLVLAMGGTAGAMVSNSPSLASETGILVHLFNKGETLTPTTTYYLNVWNVGKYGDGDTFTAGATTITYQACSKEGPSEICGPAVNANVANLNGKLDVEYATVIIILRNRDTRLIDNGMYYLSLWNIGKLGDGKTFHVPAGANITYQACSKEGGAEICGPATNVSFPAGDGKLNVEYATVIIILYNGNTSLTDNGKYYLSLWNIGKLGYNGVFHVPAGANITYQACTKGSAEICGPAKNTSFGSGDFQLKVEYATVTFKFALSGGTCALLTNVWNYGMVPNNGVAHLPPGANITMQANLCGWSTAAYNHAFVAGANTVTWGVGPTYNP